MQSVSYGIAVIGEYNPCSLPVNGPSPDILAEQKRPHRFLFNFDGFLPAVAILASVPGLEFQNISQVFHLIEDQNAICARGKPLECGTLSFCQFKQAFSLGSIELVENGAFVGRHEPPAGTYEAGPGEGERFQAISPRGLC